MQNILVAYDGTDPAKRALDTAADLAEKFGASIGVVSVIPVHGGRVPVDPWDDNEVHARELIEARDILRSRGAEPAGIRIPRVGREGSFHHDRRSRRFPAGAHRGR